MKLCPQAEFYNIYGPAEVNQCTCHLIKEPPNADEPIPIGKTWEQTECIIIDEDDRAVEKGASGELVVHTSTMMHGYWNNDLLTQKSLYRDENGKIYYRTGDLVKENEREEFVFLGRNDRQVKVRGYRIEVDEIEAVILKHDKIVEAAVVVLDKSESEKEIMAAIIPIDKEVIDEKEVIAHCKSLLPIYAVPQIVEFMNDFPRTGSGKIDRKQIVRLYL